MPEFNCEIRLTFCGNESTAKNIDTYINQTIARFWEEHGITIDESEIHNIREID